MDDGIVRQLVSLEELFPGTIRRTERLSRLLENLPWCLAHRCWSVADRGSGDVFLEPRGRLCRTLELPWIPAVSQELLRSLEQLDDLSRFYVLEQHSAIL